MPRTKAPTLPGWVNSERSASDALAVSPPTFRGWKHHPAFPKRTADGWCLADLEEFQRRHKPKSLEERRKMLGQTGRPADPDAPVPGDLPDYYVERAKKMREEAELVRLKVEQQKGQLVPAADVERVWSEKFAMLDNIVERRFAKLSESLPKLKPADALKALREAWRGAREESAKA